MAGLPDKALETIRDLSTRGLLGLNFLLLVVLVAGMAWLFAQRENDRAQRAAILREFKEMQKIITAAVTAQTRALQVPRDVKDLLDKHVDAHQQHARAMANFAERFYLLYLRQSPRDWRDTPP